MKVLKLDKKKIILSIILLLLFLSTMQANATDKLVLKNKKILSGKIEDETNEMVSLKVGRAKFKVSKDEILKIEKENNSVTAREIDEIFREYREVEQKRETIFKLQKKIKSETNQFGENANNYLFFASFLEKVNANIEEVKGSKKEIKKKIGKMVQERNTYILKKRNHLSKMMKNFKAIKTLKETIHVNISEYFKIHYALNEQYQIIKQKDVNEENKIYLNIFAKDMESIATDFELIKIPYVKDGNNAIVDVVLNGILPAKFLIDLNSEYVAVTEKIANILEMNRTFPLDDIETNDPGIVKFGEPNLLRRLEVGEVKKDYVCTLIVNDLDEYSALDGVLGESFFYNAVKRIDTKNKEIILYNFNFKQRD